MIFCREIQYSYYKRYSADDEVRTLVIHSNSALFSTLFPKGIQEYEKIYFHFAVIICIRIAKGNIAESVVAKMW